ncbi:hypothetical protein [Burkholderia cenocepacia]|uniref:hypothetical protein n=1 Tax=Burkholderia cenocepacia TaxID=95486 RepID=UPI000980F12C|nr:hypothetical protein [Burkholderia cenocepacia]ONP91716.1 hypothetical protein A8D96_35450 [Burkholderia cenocepacia]
MSSNSYVNLKIATCLVRYADDRLIDQRFPKSGAVVPSFIENAALERDIRASFVDVITQFVNTPSMTSATAVKKLATAAKNN